MSTNPAFMDPASSLDALVERTRALLGGPDGAEPGPFVGESAEGMVRAEVGAEGRVQSLRVDPRMLRGPLEDICREVVVAVNQALDARPARPDTAPLLAELRAVQEESVGEMQRISASFSDALREVVRGRRS
jgi:hypothetical protein